MFKVECLGCQAPYQVDEKRVPSGGLRMRCPKCGTRFTVQPPSVGGGVRAEPKVPRPPGALSPSAGLPARRPSRDALARTMIGVAGADEGKPAAKATAGASDPVVVPEPPQDLGAKPPKPPPRVPKPRTAVSIGGDPQRQAAPGDSGSKGALGAKPSEHSGEAGARPSALGQDPPGGAILGSMAAPRASGKSRLAVPLPRPIRNAAESAPTKPVSPDLLAAVRQQLAESSVAELPAKRFPLGGKAVHDDDLPAVLGDADLPAPADKHAVSGLDAALPVARASGSSFAASSEPRRPSPPDLPSKQLRPGARIGLSPAEAGQGLTAADNTDDLPAVFGGDDLPSLSQGADLPAVFGDADLPALGHAADLPAVFGGADLPMPSAPKVEAELPAVFGGQVAAAPRRAAAEKPIPVALGQLSTADAEPADLPSVLGGGDPADTPDLFGTARAIELAAPLAEAGPPPLGGLMGAAPHQPLGPAGDDPFAELANLEDPFGEQASLEADLEPAAPSPAVPAASGGFGEIELAAGAGDALAIDPEALAPAAPAIAEAPLPESDTGLQNGATVEVARPERPRRRRPPVGFVVGGALALAGAALALNPELGPFGVHLAVDALRRDQYEKAYEVERHRLREALASDSFSAVRQALTAVEQARQTLPRYRALAALSVFGHAAGAIRFGPWPEGEALARSLWQRVEQKGAGEGGSDPRFALASAAVAALGDADGASRSLSALGGIPEAELLRAELLLRTGPASSAVAAWAALGRELVDSPQGLAGLGRARLAVQDWSAAKEAAQALLERDGGHSGARIILLEVARAQQASPEDAGAAASLVASLQETLPQAAPADAAWGWSVLGETHLSYGRSVPAQQSFERALAARPGDARALVGLGESLLRAEHFPEALARFEAARKAAPTSFEAKLGVAKARVMLKHLPEARAELEALAQPEQPEVLYWQARADELGGDAALAIKGYRRAIKAFKDPNEALAAYLSLASAHASIGELDRAEQALTEARRKLRPSAELARAMGKNAFDQGHFETALERYDEALRHDPTDTAAKFSKAVTLVRLGRFDKAIAEFDSVGASDPQFPGLALERGRLFEESGRQAEALKEFELALQAAPNDSELELRVGCARVAMKQLDAAVEALRPIVAKHRSAEAHLCLGRALLEQGATAEAGRMFERAVALDATRAPYFLYLGWAMNALARPADAERALERAIALDSSLGDAYWQRGLLRRKQGAAADAALDLRRALELKPARTEALAELALAYADLGEHRLSIEFWKKALAHDPENATWLFRLGKAMSSVSGFAAAAEPLAHALELVTKAEAEQKDFERPPWLWQAHYLLARAKGDTAGALAHWQAVAALSPPDHPYRSEAKKHLRSGASTERRRR